MRALIAMLTYLGPLVRGLQRYLGRLRGVTVIEQTPSTGSRQPPAIDWFSRSFVLRYWSEQSHEKESLLSGVMEFLIPRKYLIAVDPGWNQWDVEIFRGIWSKARVAVATENHGGTKRLLNVRSEIRLTRVSQLSLGFFAILVALGVIFEIPEVIGVGAALGLVNLGVIVSENVRLARILNDTYDIVAEGLGLRPVNGGGTVASAEAA